MGCVPVFPRSFCHPYFDWYNWEHHHSGIALLTPGVVHYGKADDMIQLRQRTLTSAFAIHPERFVLRVPSPALLPGAVWINPPQDSRLGVIQENGSASGKTEPQDRVGTSFSEPDDLNIVQKSDLIVLSDNPRSSDNEKEVAIATLN